MYWPERCMIFFFSKIEILVSFLLPESNGNYPLTKNNSMCCLFSRLLQVIHMEVYRMSRRLLYEELASAKRYQGRPKNQHKDSISANFHWCNIRIQQLEESETEHAGEPQSSKPAPTLRSPSVKDSPLHRRSTTEQHRPWWHQLTSSGPTLPDSVPQTGLKHRNLWCITGVTATCLSPCWPKFKSKGWAMFHNLTLSILLPCVPAY